MKLSDSVVLVTGANRGLGLEYAKQALARGAKKVYAAARDVSSVKLDGVEAVELDVTDGEAAAALASRLSDVTVVINNAGIARLGGFVDGNAQKVLREQLETNVFGILNVSQAFAPVLARNGGGAILNMLSILSWINTPSIAAYGASKSAAWGLTNGLRHELRAQGTQVVGVHAGFIDTDLTKGFDVPKAKPEDVVRQALDAIEAGAEEVFVDEPTRQVHGGLTSSVYLKDVISG
ncbi:NAD(P)-dependent dehydrogenase (short-subunit alcohol dehydrogenase family) [Luteibacter sp. HA06]|jgi:NAD(P)-dependent dehydrogenase (short-subunit alcohol dehydrogenase family)